jgi:3-oxoacyl-[acyl-carrier protein] reductase
MPCITVNNVQPGPIDTDVSAIVSFLAGPESGYVTGANWNVDGGFTV